MVSPVVAAGVALVGDFTTGATIWDREQARVTFTAAGLSDDGTSEMFRKNEIRFRGEERLAFGVEWPAAFCAVENL